MTSTLHSFKDVYVKYKKICIPLQKIIKLEYILSNTDYNDRM